MTATATTLHRPVLLLILLALLPLLAGRIAAQVPALDDGAAGTKYIIAFPDTVGNRLDSRYPNNRFKDSWNLFLYSAVNNNRVRISTVSGSPVANVTLQAGKFQVQDLRGIANVTRINGIEDKTVTVESDFPIALYCYAAARQGMEAWTPIPVEMWGTEYNVAALPGQIISDVGVADETAIPFDKAPAPAEILVMAAYDNTKVSIRPGPGQTLLDAKSIPIEVTLNAGQCYQVQSIVDTTEDFDGLQVDLGGVSVRADKPIGVISGNTRTLVRQDKQGLLMNAYKNMLIEWLAPVEQHGTEFVFMPSWDSHRPGIGSSSPRDREYVRVYGTSAGQTRMTVISDSANPLTATVRKDSLVEFSFSRAIAAYIKTDRPAQAIMHSTSILLLASKTPCFRGIPCQTFDAWAPFMTELTPREQWTSFAPYYAPVIPSPMEHYINVVTDTVSAGRIFTETGTQFPFTWKIPGTDLIWGTMEIASGVDHYLVGREGARFAGSVHGVHKGGEVYRPGRARKKDDRATIASGNASEQALHPAEYEEYNALSYGYPLTPRRLVLRGTDSIRIDSARACAELALRIRITNPTPVGLRSVALDPTSAENVKLVPVNPAKLSDILGRNEADVKLVPINPAKNAKGTLVIKDRAGRTILVPYSSQAAALALEGGSEVRFGRRYFATVADTAITFRNNTDHDIMVNAAMLGTGGGAFSIVSTLPEGPALSPARSVLIKKGESLVITLRLAIPSPQVNRADMLKLQLDCIEIETPLSVTVFDEPRLLTYDVDFGVVPRGDQPVYRDMKVCNAGLGTVTFANALADSVIAWNGGDFTITRAGLDSLKNAVLRPAECIVIRVGFNPTHVGVFTTTARLSASTSLDRDFSVWRAIVSGGSSSVAGEDATGNALAVASPNPASGLTTIGYTLAAAGHVRMVIYNTVGERVATLVDEVKGAGEQSVEWDARGMAAGVYYCRVSSGAWGATRTLVIMR